MGNEMPTFRYDIMLFSPGVEVSLEIEDTALPRNLRIWLPSDPAPYPRRTEFSATPGDNGTTRTEPPRHKIVTMAKHPNSICIQDQFSYFTISETVFSFVNDQSVSLDAFPDGETVLCIKTRPSKHFYQSCFPKVTNYYVPERGEGSGNRNIWSALKCENDVKNVC
jgi:hypothetical protein